MTLFDVIAVLLTLSALFSYINHCYIRLPASIGVMLLALLLSLGLVLAGHFGLPLDTHAARLLSSIDFNQALLHGMLSFLLFAGALHVNLNDLASQKWVITLLATIGLLVSTFLVGTLAWVLFDALGLTLPLLYCLLFGALISPTDPIAVLGILKAAGAPKNLEIKVVGESLFNDGVGVVLFTALVLFAQQGEVAPGALTLLLGKEVLGGLLLGLGVGWLAERALRTLDEPNLEILITVAAVFGIGFVAGRLHVSGPLAAVAAGLLIGNQGRQRAMSARTENALDTVWTFLDEALNAMLFLLIGIEVFAVDWSRGPIVGAALLLIPLVLLARWLSVAAPLRVLRSRDGIDRGAVPLLTWGGLKGGISIALAMKTPAFDGRDAMLAATYAIVVFSVVVQGLTVGRLVRWMGARAGGA